MTAASATSYGLIGLGRIGRRVIERLGDDAPALCAVLVRPEQAEDARAFCSSAPVCSDLAAFLAHSPAAVVECASAAALAEYGPAILASGADLLPLSLAAFADPAVERRLCAAAAGGPGRIELAAGAAAGLDFLATAVAGGLAAVTIRVGYPTARWRGTPAEAAADLASIECRSRFFAGSARQAARMFPRHLNVCAGLALAGLGLDATRVELFADPALLQADFEVVAEATAGSLRLSIGPCDVPPGAGTIDHTTFSVMRLLRRRVARIAV
jgi:aspartate dehydrogenase